MASFIKHPVVRCTPQVVLHPDYQFTPQADRFDVALLRLDRSAYLQVLTLLTETSHLFACMGMHLKLQIMNVHGKCK